ncbi:unnamed protein product [Rhodiola kirilowii]
MEKMRSMEVEVEEAREYFDKGNTKAASWRRQQLKGLRRFVKEQEEAVFRAVKQDLGKHRVEAYRDEIGTVIKALDIALASLKSWISKKKAVLPVVAFPSTAHLVPEPLGLVLVISSWNYPFGLALEPIIGALAAGNTVVLKPSELSPTCSSVLASILPNYVDRNAVKVIQGGADITQNLLDLKWDKILFTGSPNVARIVMTAAAKHLTPVILELGGKCPAVIDTISCSMDRKVAVKRVLGAKFGACGGQACIAIDYILVEKKNVEKLVELLKKYTEKMFGENPKDTNSMARIVNKQHFLRLKNLIDDPKVKNTIVHGGLSDENSLFIEPTILLDPPLDSAIMTDEIFGPLLPIITLESIEDSVRFINARPKPLAVYLFSNNSKLKKMIVSNTSSGTVAINDAMIQYVADTIPFGGVGGSGFGRYHGKFSFDAFSHEKGVLHRGFFGDIWFRFPPWNAHKLRLFKSAYAFDYLGMALVILRLKKK